MSDVLIKGMEMPKCCRKCDLHSYTRTMAGDMMAYCLRLRHEYGFTVDVDLYLDDGRHPECPLVEVKPHGCLIDATELEAGEAISVGKEAWDMVHNAPVILEATE